MHEPNHVTRQPRGSQAPGEAPDLTPAGQRFPLEPAQDLSI